eukprot:COSAG01_NODE_2969_length_6787_cov_11.233702_5_plen_166_part_00
MDRLKKLTSTSFPGSIQESSPSSQQASELWARGGPHVSADLRGAAARQSPRSATRPKGARQPASQPGGANLNRDENATAKVTRPQWSRPRPRESARDVREVVREHLRAPEQGAPRANAHRAAQRAPNRARSAKASGEAMTAAREVRIFAQLGERWLRPPIGYRMY